MVAQFSHLSATPPGFLSSKLAEGGLYPFIQVTDEDVELEQALPCAEHH